VAVLIAYRAAWSAFEHALADANPQDPELATTMVDPQLQSVKANLLADQRQGIVGRGTTTLHPKVTALSAVTATVVDCAYSSTELVYKATGKPVPPTTPPENDGVTATLVLSGGSWRVSKQTVTDGTCVPGS
jgi:endonuclease/exonuclease/phosphatase (EEP) superfamily protein YafD